VSEVPVGDNRLRQPLAEAFARVPSGWRSVTDPFIESPTGRSLAQFVDARLRGGAVIYPANVFRALELAAPRDVRVVILGQDPVTAGHKLPPSLRNILAEVRADTGAASICETSMKGDLSAWAEQGVLLLNSVLSVEDGQPHSHANRGWEVLTDALLVKVAAGSAAVVFMLWGAAAQRKRALVDEGRHRVLMANHPSPLSARRPPEPFIGCRHFTRANMALADLAPERPPIRW